VGWRERDWAKLRDEELEALYGFRRPAPPRRTVSTRMVVWPVVGIVTTAFFTFAFLHRETAPPAQPTVERPSAVYGYVWNDGPLGRGAVCQELELVPGTGWRCDAAVVNIDNVPVIRPTEYGGPCGHLKVDDAACVAPPSSVG
jgi:hypothetical protein